MLPRKSNIVVLGQIIKLIPRKLVESLQKKYRIQTRGFSCMSHVCAMLFAQLSHALSLNDVCDTMRNHAGYLQHIRNCTPPSRNGLSHASKTRDCRMAKDLFWMTYNYLTTTAPSFLKDRKYIAMPRKFKRAILAVDSTTIQLIANCLDWAKHRAQKAAVKLHVGIALSSFLPAFALVRAARHADAKIAWELCENMRPGEIVVFDKAYCDFGHLYALEQRGVFWVTRAKENIVYEVVGQQPPDLPPLSTVKRNRKNEIVGRQTIILQDSVIKLQSPLSKKKYPDDLRMVIADVILDNKYKRLQFITNNLEWAPSSICDLYKSRWAVEVFFKEIKQTLQLADFLGTSANAVEWQIWTALLAYLLLRFLAYTSSWSHSFSRLFTTCRGVLWGMLDIQNLLSLMSKTEEMSRGSPLLEYQQLEFNF